MFNARSRSPAQALLWLIHEARLNSGLLVNETTPEVRAIVEAHQTCEPSMERDRYKEALEFYANPGTYWAVAFAFDPPTGGFDDDFEETEIGRRPGKRARAAIAASGARRK